jgi:hypothetical protein
VYRILGTDIEVNDKLNLILDGILKSNLIESLKVGDLVILLIEKPYKGIVTKINKHSYSIRFDKLELNANVDKNGLTKINNKWCRCIKFNKKNAIPLWCESISSCVKNVLSNKNLEECQSIVKKIKNKINKL